MKGQISIEFIASAFFFLLGVILVLNYITGLFPDFRDDNEEAVLNKEMKRVTDQLIKTSGSDWTTNPTEDETVGLASDYMILSNDKINSLENLDYTNFTQLMGLENSYHLTFTKYSVNYLDLKTGQTSDCNNTQLVVSRGDILGNETEIVKGSNGYYICYGGDKKVKGDSVGDYELKSFSRSDNGKSVVIGKEILEYGPPLPTGSVERLERYVELENATDSLPMEVEVVAWES